MSLKNYIENYKNYTFEEIEFNEVDNVIFSLLSYVNLDNIVPSNDKNKISIGEAAKIYFNKYNKKDFKKNIIAIRSAIKLLDDIKETKRYKDILMFNYKYIKGENEQFKAITFYVKDNIYYVSFEGTDELISGWMEDLRTSYMFPVESQMSAKRYLTRNFLFKNVKLIIGGHSKGGNLALTSSMLCNNFLKNKIIKIYNNDGQGLRKKEIESRQYKAIESKLVTIIPNYSIVGLLLRQNNCTVIKSSKKGIMAHDATTWITEDDHFKRETLSRFSNVFNDGISKWLDKYGYDKREIFEKEITKLLKENEIESLLQIKEKKTLLIKIIKSAKDIDPIVKKMVFDLVKLINKTNFEYPIL